MLVLLLAACDGKPAPVDDTAPVSACTGPPTLTVASPADGATVAVGEPVSLAGSAVSSDGSVVVLLWAIDGDVEVIGATGTWTPNAPDTVLLTFQGEDACGIAQVDLHITVVGDDTAPADTADTGDTDTPPAAELTLFGPELGFPVGAWRGLSVAPDHTVWAANSGGLVHLDGESVSVYGTADGLTTDGPTAVLAALDGTIWVGHAGDVKRHGEQVSRGEDGTLTVERIIDYTESDEIAYVLSLGEQPFGVGTGDVWMGTNEGVCVWDADLDVYAEHAHPTHPHGNTEGVAFTPEGDIWNGDAYQLSRWRYSNDGNLSPSADLFETVPVWPVMPEEPIDIADLAADGTEVWVVSPSYGVARVDVAAEVGGSTVQLYAEPLGARAVRVDTAGYVWIGTTDGLWRWDGVALAEVQLEGVPADGVWAIAVDATAERPTTWFATSAGLLRLVGEP